jgi:hypothetical protein
MRKLPGRKVRAPEGSAAGNSQPMCRKADEDQSYRDELSFETGETSNLCAEQCHVGSVGLPAP